MACTFFPEGSWKSCCSIHDKDYSKNSKVSRKNADKKLAACVKKTGNSLTSKIMYAGVRTFGWMFYRGNKND